MAKGKKSANGAGSIRKRTDGRWEGRFSYQDELGRPQRGSVYGKTQREVRRKMSAILPAVDTHEYTGPAPQITLKQWLADWVQLYVAPRLKPRTEDSYQKVIDRYIVPLLGDLDLRAVSPLIVQRWTNTLRQGWEGQAPLSAKTVANAHGCLHGALGEAVRVGLLQSNPADRTRLPRQEKPELHPLMDKDLTAFLQAIRGARFEYLFKLAIYTGMRQSELLGLQWPDVDLDGQVLTVRRQLQRGKDGYTYITPKNGKRRTVPLIPSAVDTLRAVQRQQAEWRLAAGSAWSNPDRLVFVNELGGHLSHSMVYHHFHRIVYDLGLERVRFHDLRHTAAILA